MTFRHFRAAALFAPALFALAACTAEPNVPPRTATPTPQPAPQPRPTPKPVPVPENWMDAPRTPGTWHYQPVSGGTQALYDDAHGQAAFIMQCDRGMGTIILARPGAANGPAPMRVLTETQARLLDARPYAMESPALAARLSARDPLLDAMAFSKGRFAIEIAGLPTLYLPSWTEVSRVIEDCR